MKRHGIRLNVLCENNIHSDKKCISTHAVLLKCTRAHICVVEAPKISSAKKDCGISIEVAAIMGLESFNNVNC